MRVLLWHVHGAWTNAFVQGDHDYVIPVRPDRKQQGPGSNEPSPWPERTVEVPTDVLHEQDVDVVVLQRPHEAELCREWLGRIPGRDVPAVYLEHNTPGGGAVTSRHPLADQRDITVVHVTYFNQLMWDNGHAPTTVIEHGIVDPGYRYTGEQPRAGVVINEPVRRGRAVGTDLLPMVADAAPLDVFGIDAEFLHGIMAQPPGRLRTFSDVPQEDMHDELAQRRVYVHLNRWTSLGLSLLEAMHLGMPVVVLGTTEAPSAVPAEAGCVSVQPAQLSAAIRRFVDEPEAARTVGQAAREAALSRYGLKRFLDDWDQVLHDLAVPAPG